MARSPGFGSNNADLTPFSDSVSLRLPYSVKLANTINSLTHYTKGTQSPRIKFQASTACTHTVSGSISLPSPGFFSPFPHGTCSLSVSKEYLALEDGPPSRLASLLQTGFLVSRLTFRTLTNSRPFAYGAITLFRRLFQTFLLNRLPLPRSGYFPFARHYLGNLG